MPFSLFDSLRILGILGGSALLTYAFPAVDVPGSSNGLLYVFLMFSFLLGFFVNRALERKQQVGASAAVELQRLRRMKHLSEGMGDAAFRERLKQVLEAYQRQIARDFLGHEAATALFREVTHLIYRYQPKTETGMRLWEGMMEATHEIALERQRLEQALPSPLTPYSWLLMGAMAGFAAVLLLLNRNQPSLPTFGAALSLGSLFLGMDLLVQTSRLSKREVVEFQGRYLTNIEKSKD